MESKIIQKISPNKIIEIFEYSKSVNIRWYAPLKSEFIDDFDAPIDYKITIRHNHNENAKELLEKAIKEQSLILIN